MTSDVLPPPFERSARLDLWQEELEQESAFIDALIDCADVFEECPDDIHHAIINGSRAASDGFAANTLAYCHYLLGCGLSAEWHHARYGGELGEMVTEKRSN